MCMHVSNVRGPSTIQCWSETRETRLYRRCGAHLGIHQFSCQNGYGLLDSHASEPSNSNSGHGVAAIQLRLEMATLGPDFNYVYFVIVISLRNSLCKFVRFS
jgi:hypothetical protein